MLTDVAFVVLRGTVIQPEDFVSDLALEEEEFQAPWETTFTFPVDTEPTEARNH